MNYAIRDMMNNPWRNDTAGQISFWRNDLRLRGYDEELDEFNAWVKEKGLEPGDEPRIDSTPTYYDFPGGVQVRDISAHLTSFGGQALQYVARATRLDGNNKGEAVKDLRKAIDFIGWEIERLESNA